MTTHFRTLLLLGFTALTASLSGCIVETTHDRGDGPQCAPYQYFQVYWSVDTGNPNAPLLCDQVPPSHVELLTNNGTYQVGVGCRATPYMGFVFDFLGSTNSGIPVGTYVTSANLVSDANGAVLSTAPGSGGQYSIPACNSVILSFLFSLF